LFAGTIMLVASFVSSEPLLLAQTGAGEPILLEVTWKLESAGRGFAATIYAQIKVQENYQVVACSGNAPFRFQMVKSGSLFTGICVKHLDGHIVHAEGQVLASQQGAKPAKKNAGRSAPSSMSWKEKQKLLTLEDLEKVTGLKGLKPGEMNNERDQMLVFSKQDKFGDTLADFIVVSANVVIAEGYWEWITKQGKTSPALVPVSGVGDEAFEEPRDPVLYFRKGKAAVMMTFSLSPLTSKPYVTAEQMRELAKIMAGRL